MSTDIEICRHGSWTFRVGGAMAAGVWAVFCALSFAATLGAQPAAAADKVFTIANYPVEAKARDAVAAKRRALKEGQQAALRSLLKRIVPVFAYPQLKRLKKLQSSALIDGVAVRSERNSRTEYLASMDFLFRPKAVRDLLRRKGIPFLDQQAAQVILIPIYRAPTNKALKIPPEYTQADGARLWTDVWKELDLDHALTPLKLRSLRPDIHPDTINALIGGDNSAFRIITSEYSSEFVLLAIAEPNLGAKRLNVTLIGRDSVDRFAMTTGYRIQEDLGYTAELAAVVGLGVIEGRWKSQMVGGRQGASNSAALSPVRFSVSFRTLAQWRSIRTAIARTPGVERMEVAGLSARGATVSLHFPGGAAQLTQGLTQQGLFLRDYGNGLQIRGN